MNSFNYQDIVSRYVPYNNTPTIKGKFVSDLQDVIKMQSSDLEPAICANLNSGKIYVKMFNIDGTYKIEEFIRNPDFVIDSRQELDKVKEQLANVLAELEELKLKGGNLDVSNNDKSNNSNKHNKPNGNTKPNEQHTNANATTSD